jgi:hypothetical protein
MQLKEQLSTNTDALIQRINQFSDVEFNKKPDADSWSAGEVLEHLFRSEFGLPRLFTGEVQELTHRKPDAFVNKMKERFLESDKPLNASGVILPTEGVKSKSELIQKFKDNRAKIADLIEELPPEELCLKFEHPLLGFLTRMEWVYFSIIHTQRHLLQLDRIEAQL